MWNSVDRFRKNLNEIAQEVYDDDDDDDDDGEDGELSSRGLRDRDSSSLADRRSSHNFAHSMTPTHSPAANGFESAHNYQIEQYKADIKRLQESEAEIKALSVNYAALLKEKENQILRLHEENGTLKQNLHTVNAALASSRSTKGSDQSPKSLNKSLVRTRSNGSPSQNGGVSKQNIQVNGIGGSEKELTDLLEEKSRAFTALQATHESELKQLGAELKREREKLTVMNQRMEEERKLRGYTQQELSSLRVQKDQLLSEKSKIHDELNQKISDVRRLQMELQRKNHDETDEAVDNLRRAISTLEKENSTLKIKNDELATSIEAARDSSANKHQSEFLRDSAWKEEMEKSLQKLEKESMEVRLERDKALQELKRLKQHLLEKESEEADKMDEDSKVIEELRAANDYQKSQIMQLERTLKLARTNYEELKLLNENETKKSKEVIDDLSRKLEGCMSMIKAKNVEVLNLQTALGQYYAEIEAKERLEEDLVAAKEESTRLSELLKDSHRQVETLKVEKEEMTANLSKGDRILAEGKNRVNKLESDNEKLRRALEQSMTRLNRMSVDSDFLVDRRIVIKLLVTYFQKNHSKEVLDLMVRMLGFSEEDKQRIGGAQQGGKGVVRGVLGLPGRFVGGILGGGSTEASNIKSDDQSFADLWVDFLLKENEEREKREMAGGSSEHLNKESLSTSKVGTSSDNLPNITGSSGFGRPSPFQHQNLSKIPVQGTTLPLETSESEFSTVPLSAGEHSPQVSRLLGRYS